LIPFRIKICLFVKNTIVTEKSKKEFIKKIFPAQEFQDILGEIVVFYLFQVVDYSKEKHGKI
jgi:hypothetical protein